MASTAELIEEMIRFCRRSSKRSDILKAVRKRKNYAIVAKEVGVDETTASRILAAMGRIRLVEGELGVYRQTDGIRNVNIDSELKRAKQTSRRSLGTKELPKIEKLKILDFEKALDKLNLDPIIRQDCFPLRRPFRKDVGEAYLTLEDILRREMKLPDNLTGTDLVSEVTRLGVFKRTVNSEEQGLGQLYRGAVLWLRNPSHHRKDTVSREDAFKTILFADYLIKLFRSQKALNGV